MSTTWENRSICHSYVSKTGMPLDFCENNWKSTCACRLTENEHKKRRKVQKEKDEIEENREYWHTNRTVDRKKGKRGTDRAKNNGKSASLQKTPEIFHTFEISKGLKTFAHMKNKINNTNPVLGHSHRQKRPVRLGPGNVRRRYTRCGTDQSGILALVHLQNGCGIALPDSGGH